jgi:hypothetical protein
VFWVIMTALCIFVIIIIMIVIKCLKEEIPIGLWAMLLVSLVGLQILLCIVSNSKP